MSQTDEETIPQEMINKATEMFEEVFNQVLQEEPNGEWYADMVQLPHGRVIIALVEAAAESRLLALNLLISMLMEEAEEPETLGKEGFIPAGAEWNKEKK